MFAYAYDARLNPCHGGRFVHAFTVRAAQDAARAGVCLCIGRLGLGIGWRRS